MHEERCHNLAPPAPALWAEIHLFPPKSHPERNNAALSPLISNPPSTPIHPDCVVTSVRGDPCQLQHQWGKKRKKRRRKNLLKKPKKKKKKKEGGIVDIFCRNVFHLWRYASTYARSSRHLTLRLVTTGLQHSPIRSELMWRITYTGSVGAGWPPVTVSFTLSQILTEKEKKRERKREDAEGCASASGNFRDTCLSPRYFWLAFPPSATRLIIFQPKSSRRRHRWMEDHEVCITRREEEEEEERRRRRRRRECARRARWGTGTQPWFFLFRGVLMELCVCSGVGKQR